MAPPGQRKIKEGFASAYTKDTRCAYFSEGRTDLHILGATLGKVDEAGGNGTSVKRFLLSDIHMISTVVGCIRDILEKKFIGVNQWHRSDSKSVFKIIQERLRGIILAVLVLFISFNGYQNNDFS